MTAAARVFVGAAYVVQVRLWVGTRSRCLLILHAVVLGILVIGTTAASLGENCRFPRRLCRSLHLLLLSEHVMSHRKFGSLDLSR